MENDDTRNQEPKPELENEVKQESTEETTPQTDNLSEESDNIESDNTKSETDNTKKGLFSKKGNKDKDRIKELEAEVEQVKIENAE